MYDEQYFTRDVARVTFHETDGIELDDNDEPTVNWDQVDVVRKDNPPHAEAFDTKRFYRLPATVARPIEQPYRMGDELVTFKKPRPELKKAAWSLDNAPWTMGHPETGVVKDVDDIRGFWSNPRYTDAVDDLDADLHVPVDDDEAKEFIEENGDVSVGFYNKLAEDHDGVTEDSDSVDGYQVDIYFDHVASVETGRCPSDQGCGIDAATHGHTGVFKGTSTTEVNSDDGKTDMEQTTDQPSGIKTHEGQWFAVGPGEHTKDSTDHPGDHMFPVDSCSDIEDAWNLRGSAEDLEISEETLAQRIVRAAEAKDCDGMPSTLQEQMDSADEECGCGCGGTCEDDSETDTNEIMTEFDIDMDDLQPEAVLDKVAEQHEGVEARLDELRQNSDAAEAAEEAAEEIECDVDELPACVGTLADKRDELEQRVDELEQPKREELAESILDVTDRFGDEEELLEMDLDELEEKKELVEDLASPSTDKTANPESETDSAADKRQESKYALEPDW